MKYLASVWNTKYAIISRRVECVCWGVQFKEIRKVKRSSANDHVVFYSALYWQPLQIHKNKGNMFASWSLVDKTSSTVHHTLNFVYKFFEEYQPTGNRNNLNERVLDT